MPRYKVITPATLGQDFAYAQECTTLWGCDELMWPHNYDHCGVWEYDPHARHWLRLFDTTMGAADGCEQWRAFLFRP